jgi:hypothetical protein
LNEENNYAETLPIRVEGEWFSEGDYGNRLQFSVQADSIVVSKLPAFTTRGTYTHFIVVFSETRVVLIRVLLVISLPLAVRHNSTTARNGETLTVNLTAPNYSMLYLYVTRDRPWTVEGVDTSKITVSPLSSNGAGDYEASLYISKADSFTPEKKTTTTFHVVSGSQRVTIIVTIIPPAMGEWIDPRPGEEGVNGTGDIYLYL